MFDSDTVTMHHYEVHYLIGKLFDTWYKHWLPLTKACLTRNSYAPSRPLSQIVYRWITSHQTPLTPLRHCFLSVLEMQTAKIDEEKTEDDFSKPYGHFAFTLHRSCWARHLVSLPLPLCILFFSSLLLKVGTSNPLLNLLNGAKPIYQLTHFRWIIYPFILSDNATDVTRGIEAVFLGEFHTFLLFLTVGVQQGGICETPWWLWGVIWAS